MPEQQLAQQLREIIARYGVALADEPRRTNALLRDLCAKHKPGEVRVLAAVAEEGLARELKREGGKISATVLLPRLAERLHDDLGVDRDLALWAITAWAEALEKALPRLDGGGIAGPSSPSPRTPSSHHQPPASAGGKARPRIGQTGRYLDNGDGTVTDVETRLQWMRCSLGQTWDGKRCAGRPSTNYWQEALSATDGLNRSGGYAGYRDWRMPTVEELNSLVYCSSGDPGAFPFAGKRDRLGCGGDFEDPTIDSEAFPNTDRYSSFWSASPSISDSDCAWMVYFGFGCSFPYRTRGYRGHVRLVRGGQ